MTDQTMFEYVTAPNGLVHLAYAPAHRTICGRTLDRPWKLGDETVSGISATCLNCKRIIRQRFERVEKEKEMPARKSYSFDSVRRALEHHLETGAVTSLYWDSEAQRFLITFPKAPSNTPDSFSLGAAFTLCIGLAAAEKAAQGGGHKRRAVVWVPRSYTPMEAAAQIERYLPSEYHIVGICEDGASPFVMIEGHDVAGWTLDGYVLPRLASGLWSGAEVKEAKA